MWRRIREILIKEFRQTLREPRMRAFLFVPPIIQLVIFGYAVNLDVEDSRIGWMDGDQTQDSRDLRAAFEGSTYFRVVSTPANEAEARELLDRGEAVAVISVLPGFGRDIDRGDTAAVQLLIDGSNSNTASVVSAYARMVVERFSLDRLDRRGRALMMGAIAASGRDGPRQKSAPWSS